VNSTTILQLASASNASTRPAAARPSPPLVEVGSQGKAPVAFRIWGSGANPTDAGEVVFSERSAKALLREQAARGRLYSFDFDHRSLMPDAGPDAGRAAGFHRLEVRDSASGPELWAVDCDWTKEARGGFEADPPHFKYFSPAYNVDPETREAISYVNCALTNSPLTWNIPALASSVRSRAASGALSLARARVRVLHLRSKVIAASAIATNAGDLAEPATPEELITALGVLRNPNARQDDKGKALGILADHFSRIVEAQQVNDNAASMLAAARERLAKVVARSEQAEVASASRQFAGRYRFTPTHDPIVARIEACGRNSLAQNARPVVAASDLGGRAQATALACISVEEIEACGRNSLA
jgi:hypothetical protein